LKARDDEVVGGRAMPSARGKRRIEVRSARVSKRMLAKQKD